MNSTLANPTPTANTPAELIKASPVTLALDILGDRWSWLVMRDLFLGVSRFETLKRRTGAARGTLTSRLNRLVQEGLVFRSPYQTHPTRHEYRLTDKGAGLYPCALTIWAWEKKWTRDHDKLPEALIHHNCGKSAHPKLCCQACGEVVVATAVEYSPGPGIHTTERKSTGGQRRREAKTTHGDGVDTTFFHAVDIIGDRWTCMVLAALWFNQHRYDDIAETIGIATNILSDRLKRLTEAGVLERRAYRQNPTRHDYRLTEKGRDFYGFTLTLHQWAATWLMGKGGPTLLLTHSCGQPLVARVTCDQCDQPLDHGAVNYGDQNH